MNKIVLTGACGALGNALREPLADLADTLVSTDILDAPQSLLRNEEFVQADVAIAEQIAPVLKGADLVVHFAAIADEAPFETLLGPNYIGALNVWEAARQHGLRRVVYASSIHAVGLHESGANIGTDAPHRPDSYYGLAKCFAEDLGRMYWEKTGLESVCLRILSCTPEPQNTRALSTWLSYGDLRRLVRCAVQAPEVGFTVAYGVSANTRAPVDNKLAAALGYEPQDNAEDWAADFDPDGKADMSKQALGGPFATVKLGQSGVAAIRKLS